MTEQDYLDELAGRITAALYLNSGRDGTTVDRGEEWLWFVVDRRLSADRVPGLARPTDGEAEAAKRAVRAWYADQAR